MYNNKYLDVESTKKYRVLKYNQKKLSKKPTESEELQNLKTLGTNNLPKLPRKFHILTIIGHIEGHNVSPPQQKSTKYEHIIPQLVAVEQDPDIKGLLVLLNTVGGDVEAGLAISELINSLSKPKVTLVLGGGHSIGVPLATSGDYSFIAPTATMTIHPIRMNGLVIGVPQTFIYFKKMQDRIIDFVVRTSGIKRKTFIELMNSTDELANDIGTILIGEEAVKYQLINEVGGLDKAIQKLNELIDSNRKLLQ